MSFYKVKEDANYCGYNEEYLIKSDKPLADVESYCQDNVDDRTASEQFVTEEDIEEGEEELMIDYHLEEIDEEEFNRLKEEDYWEVVEV